jgi:hypothetical protein
MRLVALTSLLFTVACSSGGDALVVVTVSSTGATLSGVVSFQVTATANNHTKAFSVMPMNGNSFDIPPSKTFGILVPEAYAGPFNLTLDADDASNKTLASAANSTTTSAGKEATLDIMLTPGVILGDGGNMDANIDANLDAGDGGGGDGCVPQTCGQVSYGCGTFISCGMTIDCGPCGVTSVHPSIAHAGDVITLEGRFAPNLSGMVVVFPGAGTATPNIMGPNRATVVVPASATAGVIGVQLAGTTSPLKQPFRRATFNFALGDFRQNYEQPLYARPMPQLNIPRSMGDQAVVLDQTLMVYGGTPNGNGPSPQPSAIPQVEEADVAADGEVGLFNIASPLMGRALNTPRGNFVSANPSGNLLYVIGGGDGNGNIYSSVEVGTTNGDGSGLDKFTPSTTVSLLQGRWFAASAIIGSYLYVIGGATSLNPATKTFTSTNSIERAPINSDGTLGSFESVTSTLVTPRIGAATFVARDRLYVIGGTPDASSFLTSIEEAPIMGDGSLGTFTLLPSSNFLTLDRAIPGVFEMGGHLYVFGGASTNGGTSTNGMPVQSIELAPISPADGTLGAFVATSTTLAEPRACQPLLIGNYLYFFNSSKGTGLVERASIIDGKGRPTGFTTSAISLGMPRWGIAAAVVGKYMFLFGGSTFDGSNGGPVTAVVRSNITPDGTMGAFMGGGGNLPPLATPRVGASVTVLGRRIEVCGGQRTATNTLTDCEQFDVGWDGSLSTPVAGPPLSTAREHFQLAAIDGFLYAFGDATTTADFLQLGPNGPSGPSFSANPMTYFDTSPQKMGIVAGHSDYLIGGINSAAVQQAGFAPGAMPPSSFSDSAGVFLPSPLADALVMSTGSTAFLIGGLGATSFDMGGFTPATNNILAAFMGPGSGGGSTVLGPFGNSGPTLVQGRHQATGVIFGNNAYVIGGADGNGPSGAPAPTFNPLPSVEQATIQ